ncbi:amidohydrolase family protein [Dinoroseobacter sp. S76]|uniref:amidohydrolase family protein n=1 Tax=Dinoroseobacter sp. S76 TaxID=3415124 RepID=UPI003C7E170D
MPTKYINCNVINIKDGTWTTNTTLCTEGDLISYVGERQDDTSKALSVDTTGLWAIPGLIDLHVHLCDNPSLSATSEDFPERNFQVALSNAARNAHEAISYGITTLRDVGSPFGETLRVRSALSGVMGSHPRIFAAGPVITYPGGHYCDRAIEVKTRSQITDAVLKNVDMGADLIKVMNDPEDTEAKGRGYDPTLSSADLEFLVNEANQYGLPVACHTFPSEDGVLRAIQAGCKTIEHAAPLNEKILRKLTKNDVTLVPTISAALDEFSEKEVTSKFPATADGFRQFSRMSYARPESHELNPNGVPSSIRTWLSRLTEFLPIGFDDPNVQIATGTDAGCTGTNFSSLIREIYFLTMFGASRLRALQGATVLAAKALGDNTLGALEQGKKADIVFLSQNPLEDLQGLLMPRLVILGGELVSDTKEKKYAT